MSVIIKDRDTFIDKELYSVDTLKIGITLLLVSSFLSMNSIINKSSIYIPFYYSGFLSLPHYISISLACLLGLIISPKLASVIVDYIHFIRDGYVRNISLAEDGIHKIFISTK